jgi:hypothetical protein
VQGDLQTELADAGIQIVAAGVAQQSVWPNVTPDSDSLSSRRRQFRAETSASVKLSAMRRNVCGGA